MLIPLCAVTLFLASALLFAMEPMVAKGLLPVLGGGGAVWITAVAFFQLALLAGYLYAHFGPKWLGERRHALVHVALFAAVAVALPLVAPLGWAAPPTHQALWLFGRLAVTAGPAFVLLAATAPLVQRWFTSTAHRRASDPYFLYVASNVGSMLALLSYPFVIEPLAGLARQRQVWNGTLFAVVGLVAACGLLAARHPLPAPAATIAGAAAAVERPTWAARLRWVALSAVPSSLLLSITTFLTTDLVALPLLWILPLATYLLTFILAFSPRVPWTARGAARIQAFLLLPVVAEVFIGTAGLVWALLLVHVAAFFLTGLVCHQSLAEGRPAGKHATEFYLWVAAGGALGGLFNVFAAPLLFNGTHEYLLGLVAAALLRPSTAPAAADPRARRDDLRLPLGLAGLLFAGAWLQHRSTLAFGDLAGLVVMSLVLSLGSVFAFAARHRPLRFGLALAAIIGSALLRGALGSHVVFATRSFYAIHRVTVDSPGTLAMIHGNTIHGIQDLAPDRRREPLAYYHRLGPLGPLMTGLRDRPEGARVGVAGLGVGTLAAYQPAGAHWTFFEIDEAVLDIARDRALFTYLGDAAGTIDHVLGDARLSIAAAADGSFGALILDTFSSDAVPTHMLTREALALYLRKLRPHGLLIFNVSNRYIALEPEIGGAAAQLGLVAVASFDQATAAEQKLGKNASHWLVAAREAADLAPVTKDPRWRPVERGEGWTDDASNVWRAFRFHLH